MSLSSREKELIDGVVKYLRDTLGVPAEVRPWTREKTAPYFLREEFAFVQLRLLDQQQLLAIQREPGQLKLRSTSARLGALSKQTQLPVVLVTSAMASYERKRLLTHQTPFIVPGNQLFLPHLGMDLREYFISQAHSDETAPVSPGTQAILISALLTTPWSDELHPATVATALNYTAMTASRALKELTASGIGELRTKGRARSLFLGTRAADVWDRARPRFRSPVKRTIWALPHPPLRKSAGPKAGLSALADYTMIAEPPYPVHAIDTGLWLAAERAGVEEFPEPVDGAVEWQVWTYGPRLPGIAGTVDPLSLSLSLQSDTDERVQLALDELKDKLPW
jgi:hypothetical protein